MTQEAGTGGDGRLMITARETARRLSISERTLWSLTKDGVIRAVKVGKRGVRYPVAEIESFISRQLATV